MYEHCENDNGPGNCEKWGAVVYPKCKDNFSPFGCCICRPPVPDCRALGYNAPGLDLLFSVKIELGDPTPLICPPELEQDLTLCYPPCSDGFDGVGPVCWLICDTDQTNCGAACASSVQECAFSTLDLVLAPLVIAANIATLGLASAPAGAANAVKIGTKTVTASTRAGRSMIWVANKLQLVDPATLQKGGSLVKRIREARLGTNFKRLVTTGKVASGTYAAINNFKYLYAANFAGQTSPEINAKLNDSLEAEDAFFIKQLWATIQFEEMRVEED